MSVPASFTLTALREAYATGACTPAEVIEEALRRADDPRHPNVWISRVSRERLLEMIALLPPQPTDAYPLWGVPFAIKDNIDLADLPTTVGCPAFAYEPEEDATVVARLVAAGALPIGKTNLDQFATGLVGTRSPYGACQSVFHPEYISGGSSSGSGVAVAAGMVTFALGTDTAGSGRVPAAFGNIVGLKPTRGVLSTSGVFPACRSLDCVSIFAGSCYDAQAILNVAAGYDEEDAFSRRMPATSRRAFPRAFRFGVLTPEYRKFFGDAEAEVLYDAAIARLHSLGGEAVEFDYSLYEEAAAELYEGPWVAERRVAIGSFLEKSGSEMDPTVHRIISGADRFNAASVFQSQYTLASLRRIVESQWSACDFLLLPTTGTTYRIAEVQAEPIQLNSNLGYYTNFVNLLDLAALALPAGFRDGGERAGLPFGITLIGPAFADAALLELGARYHHALGGNIGASTRPIGDEPLVTPKAGGVLLAVVGAHLQGQPLHHQLSSRGAEFVSATRTAPFYKLHALANTMPPKPGLERVGEMLPNNGIEVEVYRLTPEAFGAFVAEVPAPLGIGSVELADGQVVKGFICEPLGLADAQEITHFGGWRAYRASLAS